MSLDACPYCEPLVVDESGSEVAVGTEGELCIAGPSVLQGYWNLPENSAKAFLPGRDTRWYRTGDIIVELPDGNYKFLGRRDRMLSCTRAERHLRSASTAIPGGWAERLGGDAASRTSDVVLRRRRRTNVVRRHC